MTPHIMDDGSHLTQVETAYVLIKSGLSPLGPLALNTNAPDEGNMYLLGHVGSDHLKEKFLSRLVSGDEQSAFFMTEPADWGGAGSDPSMMKTTCKLDGNHWVVNGRKRFITGADGAGVGIVMARAEGVDEGGGACMFLVDLPDPAIRIEGAPNTIDNSMPGGHADVTIENLRVPADQMLGAAGEGFRYAQVRLSPARLSHCMRWLGLARRSMEIAADYVANRESFGIRLADIAERCRATVPVMDTPQAGSVSGGFALSLSAMLDCCPAPVLCALAVGSACSARRCCVCRCVTRSSSLRSLGIA